MIEIVRTPREMHERAIAIHRRGQTIAFVPTMGALHRGHVTLLETARRAADVLVLSIFVNPTQFAPTEDLSRYPRPFEADVAKAAGAGVDLVYAPSVEHMYPAGAQTFVQVREVSQGLCGAVRPGHFDGVATVVTKLFNIVAPDVAFFGEKDYQQLQVIKRMVRDLDLPVEVRGVPLVRDTDGIALSSRNAYLSADDRAHALVLSRALFAARARFDAGERNAQALLGAARAVLEPAREHVRVEYLELRTADLGPIADVVPSTAVMLVAARVGPARLIDNVIFGRPA